MINKSKRVGAGCAGGANALPKIFWGKSLDKIANV